MGNIAGVADSALVALTAIPLGGTTRRYLGFTLVLASACAAPDARSVLADADLPRATLGRLSAATHQPCGDSTDVAGGCAAAATLPDRDVLDAAADARRAIRDSAAVPAMHVAALVDATWPGDGRNGYDASIYYLRTVAQQAADEESRSQARSDLAAVLLARSSRTGSARDLLESVDAAAAAVESDSTNPAAHFNLALALETFGLDGEATRQWNRYLALEGSGPWAAEGRRRVEALRGRTRASDASPAPGASPAAIAAFVDGSRTRAREFGLDTALAAWAQASTAGETASATRWLALAAAIGDTLSARGGDRMLADEVAWIRNAADRAAVARAYDRLTRAQGALRERRYDRARALIAGTSAGALSPAARRWRATIDAATRGIAGDLRAAEDIASDVLRDTDAERHPALAARAEGILFSSYLRRGAYAEAAAAARRARTHLERVGEHEAAAVVQALEMQVHFGLGDGRAALQTAHAALVTLRLFGPSLHWHALLAVTAVEAARSGLPRAALHLMNEDVAIADRVGNEFDRAEARVVRAWFAPEAETSPSDLAEAGVLADSVGDPAMRRWLGATRATAEAAAPRMSVPDAMTRLDSAVAFFSTPLIPFRVLPPLVARAQLHLRGGDSAAARRDLETAARIVGDMRDALPSAGGRATLLGSMRAVFDALVMAELRAGRDADALISWRRGRRILARGAQASVGDAPATLTHALIGDTLVTWTNGAEGVRARLVPVDGTALEHRLRRLRTGMELRVADEVVRDDLAFFYDLLIRGHALGEDASLSLDERLGALPVAALLDTATGRYLVEQHVLRLDDGGRDRRRERVGAVRALVVADPAFDPQGYPGLERLPGSASEGAAVAGLAPRSRLLAGEDATAARLTAELRRSTLLHFAGHALMDDAHPAQSELVVAAPVNGPRVPLTARRIAQMDLASLELVVLSACETARPGLDSGSRGFGGLADAFLAAGAGGVIGSSWRVDDRYTAALMPALMREYLRTRDGARALRAAQLEMLESSDPMARRASAWSGFRYAGP